MADTEQTPRNDIKAHADYTKAHGRIPDATVNDWVRMIRDPSYDFQHRTLIHRTATEALAKIGAVFSEPLPVMESKKS